MMILSCLKIIGIEQEDIIICACEGGKNWRKQHSTEYKSDRKPIPQYFWDEMNDLLDDIDISTNWNIIKIQTIEADDIMATACKYFKDREVILVTYDHDLFQMWHYDNVKIFSPHPKSKGYKIKPQNYNAYAQIAKQIEKEKGDGLISTINNEYDRKTREMLVNLLSLPSFVEQPILDAFEKINYNKSLNIDLLPGRRLKEIFLEIYSKNKVVTYEQQENKINRKIERKKKKMLKTKGVKNEA